MPQHAAAQLPPYHHGDAHRLLLPQASCLPPAPASQACFYRRRVLPVSLLPRLKIMRLRIIIGGFTVVAATGCTNPRVQANMAQAINDIGSELSAQQQDMAVLQEQIDSLKQVAAKQDTVIRRLLNVTGVPGTTDAAGSNLPDIRGDHSSAR